MVGGRLRDGYGQQRARASFNDNSMDSRQSKSVSIRKAANDRNSFDAYLILSYS